MWPKFGYSSICIGEVIITSFYKDLTRKTAFLQGWSWSKFNNLRLALGMNLKFYTSLSKGLKLRLKQFWGLILTFVEVTGENLVGGAFLPTHPILNRVNIIWIKFFILIISSKKKYVRFFMSISSTLLLIFKFILLIHNFFKFFICEVKW